jgi:N-acetylglucosamine malate deacetylase 1
MPNSPARVLVVAAHPDDEILGCGATLALHAQRGDRVHVLILAEGATSRSQQRNPADCQEHLSALAQAAQTAGTILGVTSVQLHQFPDNRMDSCDLLDIVKVVEREIQEFQPNIVYTHHCGDVNIDHRRTHEAVITAARPLPNSPVKTLLFFEIASSTEWQTSHSAPPFVPNWFVDISTTLELKREALAVYANEMRDWPHPRSLPALEYLARWRGATVGVVAAEAYILGRHLES